MDGISRLSSVGSYQEAIEPTRWVESRMGAVAWASGHRPVSHPRSSRRAVPLDKNQIAPMGIRRCMPEMAKADIKSVVADWELAM
jgi:hypothetical protein